MNNDEVKKHRQNKYETWTAYTWDACTHTEHTYLKYVLETQRKKLLEKHYITYLKHRHNCVHAYMYVLYIH